MRKITITIEAESQESLDLAVNETKRMLHKLARKSKEQTGHIIFAMNMGTGKVRKIISRSLADRLAERK